MVEDIIKGGHVVRICPELYEVILSMKGSMNNFAHGVDTKLSFLTLSKIFFMKHFK